MATNDDKPTPPNVIAVIRYALTLSGIAMIAMAALTFAGVMFYPQRWIGIMFLMVAFVDLLIGVVIFGGAAKKGRSNLS